MVKKENILNPKKLYNTAKECIEAQLKEWDVTRCYYLFDDNGQCSHGIVDHPDSIGTTPTEMVKIATERYDRFKRVGFDGITSLGDTVEITCWDADIFPMKRGERRPDIGL